jgi:putative transposase
MRGTRIKMEGESSVYHCMTRIVGGDFFLEGEREKEVLRKQIWKVSAFCGLEVLTYCIMSNHFHVLVRTPHRSEVEELSDKEILRRVSCIYSVDKVDFFRSRLKLGGDTRRNFRANLLGRMGDISLFMKELKQRFSIWYNRSHRRSGTLWGERFKSVLVQDDPFALMTIAAYIDLNPVRAGIVSDPVEYQYCGYGEAMGGSKIARRGITRLMGSRSSWGRSVERYRVIVFGKQSSLKLRPSGGYAQDAAKGNRSVDAEKTREILNTGGRVSRNEALHCRVRYFSDGAVLGSKEFVQGYFESHRDRFGAKRRDGPRKMRGSDWEGLMCIRDLRRDVFG